MCRDGGGVRTLLNQLPAGSNAMHEVPHDLLFTIKLIRVWGEVIEAVLLIPSRVGLWLPCLNYVVVIAACWCESALCKIENLCRIEIFAG